MGCLRLHLENLEGPIEEKLKREFFMTVIVTVIVIVIPIKLNEFINIEYCYIWLGIIGQITYSFNKQLEYQIKSRLALK